MHEEMRARQTSAYPWRMPSDWWTKNQRYFLYMIRELTAVFAALWVVVFLTQVPQIPKSGLPSSPGWMLFSLVCLLFVLYHAWTWFSLMGTVMYMRFGKTVATGGAVSSLMIVVWVLASLVVAAILATPMLG